MPSSPRPRARRRPHWVDLALAIVVLPAIALALFRLGPLVGTPVRLALKASAIALPVLLLLLVLARLRRR